MKKTRLSLWYLTTYLTLGGLGLLLAPTLALDLLLADGDYGTIMPRLTGMLMVGLGLLILQVIRHDLTALYPTTLAVRAFFVAGLLVLFALSSDPLFLVLTAIVGLGLILTGASYLSERGRD